ncbi:MAG: MFS transporter [Acidimicrobiia bacterium]|nr:MAG: MFS transporter [Acidimicrobiia bacterium]
MATTDIRQRSILTGLLFSTMGVGTFGAASLGIIAAIFIADLGITRTQLGLVFAVNTVGAAVVSPFIGRFTDRIGGRKALIIVALIAAVSFLLLGAAASFSVLLVGAAVGAIAQAGSNPSTNKLIAEDLPPGSQGTVIGIKQSGVQAFIFIGGVVVPSMALAWGRQSAYIMFAGFSIGLALTAAWFLPRAPMRETRSSDRAPGRLPVEIWWITAYGFLMGLGGSSTILYALFTTERLGRSVVVAGAVPAVVGLTAVTARILWARHAERHHAFRSTLIVIAGTSVVASMALLGAGAGVWWLIWVGAVLTGIGSASWNSVGMLGLIVFAGPEAAGRASGVVLFGFLIGLGAGPPVFGWIVDSSGSYNGVWLASLVAFLASALIMVAWKPQALSSSEVV